MQLKVRQTFLKLLELYCNYKEVCRRSVMALEKNRKINRVTVGSSCAAELHNLGAK